MKLNVSAEKKKGARDVLHGLRGHNAKDLQAAAEQIFNAKYNKSVPKAVREYVELCRDEENSSAATSEK